MKFQFIAVILFGLTLCQSARAQSCRPGDIEIGRQETKDEIILYCSKIPCKQIVLRFKQAAAALKANKDLLNDCKWARRMKIDARNADVCNGKLPDPDSPDPEALRCEPAKEAAPTK